MLNEKKFYLTKTNLLKMQKEYKDLQKVRLLKIQQEASYRLHTRENEIDFFGFFEEVSQLENKIAEIRKILKNAEVIKIPPKKEQNVIKLGAVVGLLGEDGRARELEIVGSLETDPDAKKISFCSPLGQALLGHRVGDKVVAVSSRTIMYEVIKINYRNLF